MHKTQIHFFGKKLIRLILVILSVSALTFLMVDLLPGDVAFTIAGQGATLEDVEKIREDLELNQNILIRYAKWLGQAMLGELGHSFQNEEPVIDALLQRIPVTLELVIISQIFALFLAVPFGIISAYKSGTIVDKILNTAAFSVMSIPVFAMSLVFIFFFSIKLNWLPATGYVTWSEGFLVNLKSFILPGLSIAIIEWGPLMRILRSDMIATLQEDFILMAKSKGLPTHYILVNHALRPSCFTLITILGLQIGHLVGGAIIVENIFALPGIGSLLVSGIFSRDYLIVQGCILFITISYVFINFIIDILYFVLDPRIQAENNIQASDRSG